MCEQLLLFAVFSSFFGVPILHFFSCIFLILVCMFFPARHGNQKKTQGKTKKQHPQTAKKKRKNKANNNRIKTGNRKTEQEKNAEKNTKQLKSKILAPG